MELHIARDKNGDLCLFTEEPYKLEKYGIWSTYDGENEVIGIDDDLFPEVKWEDEKPTKVELVIKKVTL